LVPTQLSRNLQLACLKLWSSGSVSNANILHNGIGMIEVVSNYFSKECYQLRGVSGIVLVKTIMVGAIFMFPKINIFLMYLLAFRNKSNL
jgi:hypothetical protein